MESGTGAKIPAPTIADNASIFAFPMFRVSANARRSRYAAIYSTDLVGAVPVGSGGAVGSVGFGGSPRPTFVLLNISCLSVVLRLENRLFAVAT